MAGNGGGCGLQEKDDTPDYQTIPIAAESDDSEFSEPRVRYRAVDADADNDSEAPTTPVAGAIALPPLVAVESIATPIPSPIEVAA